MNGEQIGGIVRAILATVGGVLATKGYLDASTWQVIAGAAATIVTAIWSYKSKTA